MQELCNEFNATLMVDVAHDLGALGEDGRGHIGMQGMLGKVDIVMGVVLQDLRLEWRLRRRQEPRGEGISALLQRACHLLQRDVAGAGRDRAEGLRDHRDGRKARSCATS